MDYLIVVAAGIAGYVFGAIWYTALGEKWRQATGLSEEEVKPANNVAAFATAFVVNILIAGMIRHIFVSSGVAGPLNAAVSGFGLGLFIGGAYLALNYAFARRPLALRLIDIGHAAGSATVIAVTLDLLS